MSFTNVDVDITWMRLDQPVSDPASLPSHVSVEMLKHCSIRQYRQLYNTVGAKHLWWMRRVISNRDLHVLLTNPCIRISVLRSKNVDLGFYELDSTNWPVINLSYFGLMPAAVGQGLGYAFLCHAIDTAWQLGASVITLNTCNADHPRALPTYYRAGFVAVKVTRELWTIPDKLKLDIPDHLKM